MEINKIYQGDCLELMKQLPNNSIDLVVTDPPYNIGKDFENDNLPKEEYLKWCWKWIKELNRVTDVGGAIYLTLGWQCVAEIKVLFDKIPDLRLKNWIIWYRQDGWKGDKGFAQSHEHILYFIKDNYLVKDLRKFGEHIKEKRIEAGYKTISELMGAMGLYKKIKRKDGSEDYFSGIGWFESGKKQPSLREIIRLNELLNLDEEYKLKGKKEEIKQFCEYIRSKRKGKKYSVQKIKSLIGMPNIYAKDDGRNIDGGYNYFETGFRLPTPEIYSNLKKVLELNDNFDRLIQSNYIKFNKIDVCDDVWLTPKSEKKRLGHPTQKPVKLFKRIITASSNKGDLVLDPFMGSGTTAVACKQLGRNFIGFEISNEYCKIANKRLEQSNLNEWSSH